MFAIMAVSHRYIVWSSVLLCTYGFLNSPTSSPSGDLQIQSMLHRMDEQDSRIAAQDTHVAAQDTHISGMETHIQLLQQVVTDKGTEVSALTQTVHALQQSLDAKDVKIAALEGKQSVLEQTQTTNEARTSSLEQTQNRGKFSLALEDITSLRFAELSSYHQHNLDQSD
jgi:chromosome segregation ATPase